MIGDGSEGGDCDEVICIGVILGGYKGYMYPHFLKWGVPYPPLFKPSIRDLRCLSSLL